MPYEPPKYPGAIPTAEDLPDRVDDVDWLYAARWNELKKELRAALIELGTDPAGTFATVKARLDDMLPHFHDRGEQAGWDFSTVNFTTDGNWHDLDLSGIVPAGAKAVTIHILGNDEILSYMNLRKNGSANATTQRFALQVAGVAKREDFTVACDTDRKIE